MIKKILTFGALYVSEGIEAAIATVVIPLYLSKLGYDAATTGLLMSILSVPWIIKFVWGLITDNYAAHGRRIFILLGGITGAAMNLMIFIVHPSIIPLLISMIFIARCGIATLDVSTDALAIAITKKNERGIINGSEFMGQVLGYSFGSFYFARLTNINFTLPFMSAAIIILAMISTVFLIRDAKMKPSIKKLKHLIKEDTLEFIFLIALLNLPFGMVGIAAYYMKSNLSLTSDIVGNVMMLAGLVSAFGSLLGGHLSDKYGRKTISAFSIVGYGLTILPAIWNFVPFYIISSFFSGSFVSAICALCMDKTKKVVAGTEFSIFTSTANLGNTIGLSIGGFVLNIFGNYLFPAIALISGLVLIFLKRIKTEPRVSTI